MTANFRTKGRMIAVGDLHGCSIAFKALLQTINLQPHDTFVGLGDYVDRGPDSNGILNLLIELENQCHLVPVLGNHDQMMLQARSDLRALDDWMIAGGDVTLNSYANADSLDDVNLAFARIPPEHFDFLERCVPYYEIDSHFFVHANYVPKLPLNELDIHMLRWLSLRDSVPGPHFSGKTAVLGHTPHPEVFDLGYLIDLDTGCCKGGWLTAMDVSNRQIWQVDQQGNRRQTDR